MAEVKTIRDVLAEQRATRTTQMEIALIDFQELSHQEQMEFLLIGLLQTATTTEWCKNALMEILKRESR